jgi:SAM-dependent methyltransferase
VSEADEPNNGPAFYDRLDVFDRYRSMREQAGNANDTLEGPVIQALVGDVSGLRVLDLGCGSAAYGKELLQRGAGRYVGIDGSSRMVALARVSLHGTTGEIIEGDLSRIAFDENAFDLAISRLALHYVEDLSSTLLAVARALVPGGRIVFSVEHPVITSCSRAWTEPKRQDWIVDDYFLAGPRETTWLGAPVRKYHRTIEDHFSALLDAGFGIEHLREARPDRKHLRDPAEFERRSRIPLFLIVSGRKK